MPKVKPATRGAPPRAFPYRKRPLLFFPEGKKRITPPKGVRNFPMLLMIVYCMFALFTAW